MDKLSGGFDAGLNIRELLTRLQSLGICYSDAVDIAAFLADVPYKDLPDLTYAYIDRLKVEEVFAQLSNKVPVAYLTGRKEFYGREFYVSPDTLIPRADTESLVEKVMEKIAGTNQDSCRILDLFTGSGCILLTLLKELEFKGVKCTGTGVDISSGALSVAERNAGALEANGASFICADILDIDLPFFISENRFNIITANPPYISPCEYGDYKDTLAFEPYEALVAEDGGYFFYKNLLYSLSKLGRINNSINISKKKPLGVMYFFEIGYNQAEAVERYAVESGLDISFAKDLGGRDRVAFGTVGEW